jgi:hypothetical protein
MTRDNGIGSYRVGVWSTAGMGLPANRAYEKTRERLRDLDGPGTRDVSEADK